MRKAPSRHLRCALATAALFTSSALISNAQAGAWTEQAGGGRAIVTLRGATADDYFNGAGARASGPSFHKDDAELYLTYGVTDATTFALQTSFIRLHPDSPASSATGWDETQIGVQQRLWESSDQVASVQVSVFAPGASALTSGGVDWEVRGLYGRSFKMLNRSAFVDLELAYRWRANGFADQMRPELTLGVWVRDNLMAMAQSLNTFTTTGGRDQYFEGEQQKTQLSTVYRFNDKVAIQIGAFNTLGGRNAPVEHGALASLWFDF